MLCEQVTFEIYFTLKRLCGLKRVEIDANSAVNRRYTLISRVLQRASPKNRQRGGVGEYQVGTWLDRHN